MTTTFDDPVQQEIWTTLRALNDAWTQGDGSTLERYFHPRMTAICPTERQRLDGGAACCRGWRDFAAQARIHRWEEIDPVIQVFGDAAVVAYYFDMSFDMGGQRIDLGGRDMFFFAKENGAWWAVADQFSPYPGKS